MHGILIEWLLTKYSIRMQRLFKKQLLCTSVPGGIHNYAISVQKPFNDFPILVNTYLIIIRPLLKVFQMFLR